MSPKEIKNIAASIHDRLLNVARQQGEEMQRILGRYALERLLYRLGKSRNSERFALKGAFLFQVWEKEPHRLTRDLDLLGLESSSLESIRDAFEDIFGVPVPDDGLEFDTDSLSIEQIQEQARSVGFRIKATAGLGTAKIPLQVDIGFDTVTEHLETIVYPTLLEQEAPRIRAYPMELVVAEKTEAILKHGLLNSRLKDYFDLHHLACHYPFRGARLRGAFNEALAQRNAIVPEEPIEGLSEAFAQSPITQARWNGFLRRIRQSSEGLDVVVETISDFVLPVLASIREDRPFDLFWPPGGPWEVAL